LIAEIKRSSPSKGSINPDIDSAGLAGQYQSGGAAAISVLTEPTRFGGRDDDIASAQTAVTLPILKKDFHVTERQIAHAATTGASAALVIVRAVDHPTLKRLSQTAENAAIEIVYEVRDERELERAVAVGARMIGVNNRNLETLEIDPETVMRIVPLVPAGCIAIAESGYSSVGEIERAADAGADAVLIGSFLSASRNPHETVRGLASVARKRRSG
jgi:indole-3-glycerol phosphate synthase